MSDDLFLILTFQAGYNTSAVLAGVLALGIGGGVVGVFPFLRKRALISDAISHATLPGIGLAFLIGIAAGGTGRDLPLLMIGAAATGAAGIIAVQWIRDHTRLPEDTAIGSVLSVFFGLGIVLLTLIQTLETGGQAGLNSFLLGSTAALTANEAWLIGGASAVTVIAGIALMKEFGAVAFDEGFAAAQGWRISLLDIAMLALLLAIVAIGLKTVGLILIIALVIIPPAAARFWTEHLGRMVGLSALFGGLSGWVGGGLSALLPNMPAGAVIVLTAGAIFAISLICAPRRGVLTWQVRRWRHRLNAAEHRGLLAVSNGFLPRDRLARWTIRAKQYVGPQGRVTARGTSAAANAARQERLWAAYRARYPDAPVQSNPLAGLRVEDVLPGDEVVTLEDGLSGK